MGYRQAYWIPTSEHGSQKTAMSHPGPLSERGSQGTGQFFSEGGPVGVAASGTSYSLSPIKTQLLDDQRRHPLRMRLSDSATSNSPALFWLSCFFSVFTLFVHKSRHRKNCKWGFLERLFRFQFSLFWNLFRWGGRVPWELLDGGGDPKLEVAHSTQGCILPS